MPIPDYETLMLPLLEIGAAASNEGVKLSDATDQLAKKFKLTDKERTELLPSGGTFKFSSRASWARTYLQKAGLLEAPRRGYFRLTSRGANVLKQAPKKIDNKLLAQFDEFRVFQGKKKPTQPGTDTEPQQTPIESIASFYEQFREALAAELLDRVKKCSPQFFERLVIHVLLKMGTADRSRTRAPRLARPGTAASMA